MFNKKEKVIRYQVFIIRDNDKSNLNKMNEYLDRHNGHIKWGDVKRESDFTVFIVTWSN